MPLDPRALPIYDIMMTAGPQRARLTVVGVPCASCIISVRKALQKARGVESVGASYMLDLILVDYDPAQTTEEEIVRLIKKAGYKAVPRHS